MVADFLLENNFFHRILRNFVLTLSFPVVYERVISLEDYVTQIWTSEPKKVPESKKNF